MGGTGGARLPVPYTPFHPHPRPPPSRGRESRRENLYQKSPEFVIRGVLFTQVRSRANFSMNTSSNRSLTGLLQEKSMNPCQKSIIVHYCCSTRASAASAWGSQKVMSMTRYNSMAAVSSTRACSTRPMRPYRVPRPRWQWARSGRMPVPGQGEGLAVVGSACALSGDSRRTAMSPRRCRAYAWWPRSWC